MSARILVVDDEPDMRTLLTLILTRSGFESVEASTGEEALEIAAGAERIDLVLLDLNLPGISGLQVLEKWQADGYAADVPVLMLTADATPGRDQDALVRGARGFLTKPILAKELVAEIDRTLREHPSSPATVDET